MSKKKKKQPLESWHFTSDPLSVLEYRERDSWKKKHGKGTHKLKTLAVSKGLKNQKKKKQKQKRYHGPIGVTRKIKVFSGGLPSLGKKR